jgi:hypothetical protein
MVKHFSGLQINQAKAEFLGAAQTVKQARAVALQVSGGARVMVANLAAQHPLHHSRQFARGGSDGLGLTQAVGQASIVGSQRGSTATQAHGGAAQHRCGTIGRGLSFGTELGPPVILLLGARVSQAVKCFSLGQRLMSVPIAAISCSAP